MYAPSQHSAKWRESPRRVQRTEPRFVRHRLRASQEKAELSRRRNREWPERRRPGLLHRRSRIGRVHIRGFLWKDGIMRHLSQVTYDIGYDDMMWQKEFDVRATDTDGRSVVIQCRTFAKTQLQWTPSVYLNEAAVTLEMDGQLGTGWVEFCWNRDYFDFANQYVVQFGAS